MSHDKQWVNVVVLASGGGSDFQSMIDWLKTHEACWRIVGLVTDKLNAGAIGRAAEVGIPVTIVRSKPLGELDKALSTVLTSYRPDLIVLAGFLQKIGPKVLAKYEGRIINIHPGPLPATAGLWGSQVHRKVLELGLEKTAINIHFVNAEYDQGRTIVTYPLDVPLEIRHFMDADTAVRRLGAHVLGYEHRLLPFIVDALSAYREYPIGNGTKTDIMDGENFVVCKSTLTVDLP